jgi:ribosome-binding factor A
VSEQPNTRNKRLAAVIQRALEQTLARGLNDPRIRGLVSITGVELSQDLKTCTVKFSIYPQEHEKLTMHGLRDATAHIRRRVMKQIHIREMPRLVFKLDEGLKKQAEVMSLLAKARAEYSDTTGETPPDTPAQDGKESTP